MSTKPPSFEQMLHNAHPPEWLLDMHDHYAQTGSFRTEDVVRVLGDPRKGVEMTPDPSNEKVRASFLANRG